jgi:Ca2+-binding RTX toxin-like protein
MANSLNTDQLAHASKLLEAGGPAAMYDYLASEGYRYAILANGVAKGDSLAGDAALTFLKATAREIGKPLSIETVNSIRHDMAAKYLESLFQQADSNYGKTIGEIDYTVALKFHTKVFGDHGLPASGWTLFTPLMMMNEESRGVYWEDVLRRAGTVEGEIVISTMTVNFLSQAYVMGEPAQTIAIRTWFGRMLAGGADEVGSSMKTSIEALIDSGSESAIGLKLYLQSEWPIVFGSPTGSTNLNLPDLLNYDQQLRDQYNRNLIGQGLYNDFSKWSSDTLRNNFNNLQNPPTPSGTNGFNFGLDASGLHYSPIGAFYDSRSEVTDTAASIADKTLTLFDQNQKGLTVDQLSLRDANRDGLLSGDELNSLSAWADLNENGQVDNNEMRTLAQRGIVSIRATDFEFFTQGNSLFGASATAPTRPSETTGMPVRTDRTSATYDSNFRVMRTTDPVFELRDAAIYWAPGMVKINYRNQNYMVGTDGNDAFNANYYAATGYFNINLLTHFLAGGGDDQVGGGARNDSIWGGTGNDVMWGYAGNDTLFGEEGNDSIYGGDGADYANGDAGDDYLSGGNGADVLNGGAGRDVLLGEADNDHLYGQFGDDQLEGGAGNDYLDGGVGDDLLFGEAGADTLVGESGNDQLQGGDGNDQLLGDDGNDRLFGQTGDDTLWGGEGDDLLVGFTANNEAKQTLLLGETDNDTLYGGAGYDSLYGGLGNDVLDGGIDDDALVGNEGNDRLFGGSGNDELQGNAGNDQLSGEIGKDRLFGGVGNDQLWGGDGDDVLVGFTASNDTQQSLRAGETDNDLIYGGNGNDYALGGLGNDTLYGEAGNDDLEGGAGDDLLYGGDGNDRLFGQVGNDVLYGGAGDDVLIGFTASNEAKQRLYYGETDDDWLYGGAGRDTLLGGLGNDYLDGGAGADEMEGGQGDDTYVVNSVNDSILEHKGEGYDRVISSTNYLLNAHIEELRLVEGLDIHGTGNALDNLLIGNSRDNILDGVTGADRMVGGAGNDTYYVDNAGDKTVELANEGVDTVQASISHTLAEHIENLILLDFAKAERGMIDGQASLVYGYPKANELDYMQGDAEATFLGTCALTSIANLLTQADRPTTEGEVLKVAIDNKWTVQDPTLSPYRRGGSNYVQQQAILTSYGIRNDLITGYNEVGTANLVRSGRGVMQAVNAGALWDDPAYNDKGAVNHMVTITGVVYGETSGELLGFYIADSGRQKVSDMTRFVSIDRFRQAANVAGGYAIYTLEPLKLWDEDINATGNAQDNLLVGNRGDNVLTGGAGNDVLEGQGGNDVLDGGTGNDTLNGGSGSNTYLFGRGYGHDTITREAQRLAQEAQYVQFLEAVGPNDLWFNRSGNNLDVRIVGTNDKLTVSDWFTDPNQQNTTFLTYAGDAVIAAQVNRLIEAMAAFVPPTSANSSLPPNYQAALEPVIAASWG